MRSIRDRLRRLGKSLWLRPASPEERRARMPRLTRWAALHPARATVPRSIDEARRRHPGVTLFDPARRRASA